MCCSSQSCKQSNTKVYKFVKFFYSNMINEFTTKYFFYHVNVVVGDYTLSIVDFVDFFYKKNTNNNVDEKS